MNDLVSIIVPVYNVLPYLDKCIQSITGQTYRHFEIILVDDGSTDGSGEKCRIWAENDQRITALRTENRGVGNARNIGIERAIGKYFAFIDSDDWIHETFLETLVDEMERHDADIASCDVMLYYEQRDIYQKRKILKKFDVVDEKNKEDYLLYMPAYFCNKLFRAELFMDEQTRFPNFFYEDTALYPIVLDKAVKIVHREEPLYYYLKDRAGSTTNSLSRDFDLIRAMRYVFSYFQKKGTLEKKEDMFRKYFMSRASYMYGKGNGKILSGFEETLREFSVDQQSMWKIKAYVWGSFNVRWCMYLFHHCNWGIDRHVCFSSMISQMLGRKWEHDIEEKNPFRYQMLKSDFMQEAPEWLVESLARGIEFIILDLLEERYDILEVEDGCYITDSQAFQENSISFRIAHRIKAGSEKHWELWTEACDRWIAMIKNLDRDIKIFLLRMRLAEGFHIGNGGGC